MIIKTFLILISYLSHIDCYRFPFFYRDTVLRTGILTICFFMAAGLFSSAAGQEEIRIGLSLSLQGKYATMGKMQERGFRLWESHINAGGGILGRKIRLMIQDDQSDPKRAAALYREMFAKEKVDLVFGPYSSGISDAILPITEKYRYPVLLSGASADRLWEKGYRYAFGVYTPAGKYTVGFLQMLVKQKIKKIAIVSADDPFSASLSVNTQKWAKKFRRTISYKEQFPKGRTDLTPIARSAKNSGAEVLIVCGHLDESVLMSKALKVIQWQPKAYYASVGPATQHFIQLLGKEGNLTFSSSQWEEKVGLHFPGGDRFIKNFRERYGIPPSYHAATAYGAGMILEDALKRNGSQDRERLRETLSSMDTMTLIGRYGVDRSGKQIRHFPLVIQWQKGQKKVVWPEKLRETAPIFR